MYKYKVYFSGFFCVMFAKSPRDAYNKARDLYQLEPSSVRYVR